MGNQLTFRKKIFVPFCERSTKKLFVKSLTMCVLPTFPSLHVEVQQRLDQGALGAQPVVLHAHTAVISDDHGGPGGAVVGRPFHALDAGVAGAGKVGPGSAELVGKRGIHRAGEAAVGLIVEDIGQLGCVAGSHLGVRGLLGKVVDVAFAAGVGVPGCLKIWHKRLFDFPDCAILSSAK